jgi:hypothetical protein
MYVFCIFDPFEVLFYDIYHRYEMAMFNLFDFLAMVRA